MNTTPSVYKSIKVIDILKVVLPQADEVSAVSGEKVSTTTLLLSAIGAKVEGAGVGSVPIGNGSDHADFIKRFNSGTLVLPVAGEIINNNGIYTLNPILRIKASSGIISVNIGQIKSLRLDKK